jgi:hypothetical protein
LLERLYKSLYNRFGGRPWTHITRDWTKDSPLQPLVFFMLIGVLLAKALTINQLVRALIAFGVGIIVGHIFWGN